DREGDAARADRPDPQRRSHDPAHRARRQARHGPVRPGDGARLRQADRRGNAGRRAAQRKGHRGLPRREPHGAMTMTTAAAMTGQRGTTGTAAALLRVNGLKVAYGGIQAVKGVSFEVRDGELVSLIGANGAGKTTTLK